MKKLNCILCLIIATAVLLACVSCAGKNTDTSSAVSQSDSNSGDGSDTNTDSQSAESDDGDSGVGASDTASDSAHDGNEYVPLKMKKDVWYQVPLVTQEAKDMGYSGGEGCQWPTLITFDRIDGSTAYCGIDVGGLLKSTDGGKTWEQSTVGIMSEGTTGIAIDPTNNDRVAVIGGSSAKSSKGGLHFSTDEGVTWTPKVQMRIHGGRDYRRQVAFDESSYDKSINGCRIIYWVTEISEIENNKPIIKQGIYKSVDGGESWEYIENSADYAGSNIAVHSKTGHVYLTNSKGLYRSTNGGVSFSLVYSAAINYLDTVKSEPDIIYFTTDNALFVYNTADGDCTKRSVMGYPRRCATFLSVSPSDPNIMVVSEDMVGLSKKGGGETNYYSHDGGRNWFRARSDYSGSFIPYNPRQNPSSFHPTDSNVVIKLGGDFIMRSEDGGKNYKMSNDGYNGMCIGGKFNFNVNNPDYIAVGSQDYNGGISSDGGKTWTYLNWAQSGWGGFTYGAYMINGTSAVTGLSTSWYGNTKGVEIITTFDSGKTINRTGIITTGATIGMGVKGNESIVFYADHRSTDAGRTWTKMNGCDGVFTDSADGSILFGKSGNATVVISRDKGETWQTLVTLDIGKDRAIEDIAYNSNTKTVFVPSFTDLYKINLDTGNVDKDSWWGIKSVAVDPENNDIMYASVMDYSNYSADSAFRSIDGGKTWICINRSANDGREGPDGGRATSFVRVDGEGSAWYVGHCRGLWKIARPDI